MSYSPRLWLGVVAAALLLMAAEPPAKEPAPPATKTPSPPASTSEKPPAAPEKPAEQPLDTLKVPANAVLVICKSARDALGLVAEGIVLTPEKYQGLLDRIDQLERQLRPAKPDAPKDCKLSGQVEGDLVHLQAQFEFQTHQPMAQVALGCQRAWTKGAALDGHLPLLLPGGDDGLLVQVDTPGAHQLTLDLEVPLAFKGAKGGERGFDLGLPRAAITSLDQLSLPAQVTEVRVNGRAVTTKTLDAQHQQLQGVLLGAADRLDLSWKGPSPAPLGGAPLLMADAQISVLVDHARVAIEAELTLQTLQGETKEWSIQVPPQVTWEIKNGRVDHIDRPDPKKPILTVWLKEASAEPLRIVLQMNQARTAAAVPVGPFSVLKASRQQGTMIVSAPADLRLRYQLHGDVSQREIPEEKRSGNAVAAFTYWSLPAPTSPDQLGPAPLNLEVETVKGSVETRLAHELHLESDRGWQITTRIDVVPIRTSVDHLEVALPPDYQYDPTVGVAPAELVENPVEIKDQGGGHRVAQLRLAQAQRGAFAVTLSGRYPPHQGATLSALDLPSPEQTLDRGGQVTATVPEGLELTTADSGPVVPAGSVKYTWRFDRAPRRIELGWRPHRPELLVTARIEMTLATALAEVQERLHYSFAEETPVQVRLNVPEALAGSLKITQGGTLRAKGWVTLDQPKGKEHWLRLTYSSPLPEPEKASAPGLGPREQRFIVPLVQPAEATRVESDLLVWSDPGIQPVLPDLHGPWIEQPVEAGPRGHDSLPALVLRSVGATSPVAVSLAERGAVPLPTVVVEEALVQVQVGPAGEQTYRARFLLTRLKTRALEIELPAPAASLNPEIYLGAEKVTQLHVVDNGNVLRLSVDPALYEPPIMLDVRYAMTAAALGSGAFHTTVCAPGLPADVFLGRVRWQVNLPPGWVNLYQGGSYTSEQRWDWRGGLLTPHSAVTAAELEHWLEAPAPGIATAAGPEFAEPSLVCWRTTLGSVQLIHLPQQAWLLICSLVFLALGLGLSFAPLPRWLLWTGVMLLVLATILSAIGWPSVLPMVIYGCEPAVVVLILVLLFQWMLHRRYRHQVVFLPGFTRLKAGSSVARGGSRPRGEPSTIDGQTSNGPKSESAGARVEGSKHQAEGSKP